MPEYFGLPPGESELRIVSLARHEAASVQVAREAPAPRLSLLVHDLGVHLDHEVGPDAQDVAVVRGMVDLAQGDAIRQDRFAPGMAVRQDVRGVEEFGVTQPAHRARRVVGSQHPGPEHGLVQAQSGEPFRVAAHIRRNQIAGHELGRVHLDHELVPFRFLADEVDRVDRVVNAFGDAHEVRQRRVVAHCLA